MPIIDVIHNGPIDTRNFFAPDTTPIASITGTDIAVRVTLLGGLTLAYTGTGLTFTGTTPTAGTITGVQILRADGSVLAQMDLTPAPWQFAEITGSGPLDSYLANGHRQIPIGAVFATASLPNWFEGGNQADEILGLFGPDSLFGGAGDDVILIPARYPLNIAPAGLTLDGGTGIDELQITTQGQVDFRNATIRNIEVLALFNGSVFLSANQIGQGAIPLTATIQIANANQPITVEQIAGRAVDLSQFTILFPSRTNFVIGGTAANDLQYGNKFSADVLVGLDGKDSLFGGGRNDTLIGGLGDDILTAGDDPALTSPFQQPYQDELLGGEGNDRLFGGLGNAFLSGDAGNDVIYGGAALAMAYGGDGNDYIVGGTGTTDTFGGVPFSGRIAGDAGNDTLVTGGVTTFLIGGIGDDRYVVNHAGAFFEELAGGGTDRITTTVSLTMTAANEIERVIVATTSGVTITGSDTNNNLLGNAGDDILDGRGGTDEVIGAAGADTLTGGLGSDRMLGGAGSDQFVFATGFGRDTIADFVNGEDRIGITDLLAVDDFADLQANHLRQVGANVQLDAGNGDVLIFRNITLSQLDATDFLI